MVSITKLTLPVIAATICFLSAVAPAETDIYKALLERRAPVLVTVKFVLKINMGGMMGGMSDEESESEVTGIMIDAKGLVLCSDTQLGGIMRMVTRMVPMLGATITTTPTDIKVLIGDDTEGREAELVARDSELDLAWLQIKNVGDAKFDYLNLSKGSPVTVGQRVVCIRRMGRYFGRSAIVLDGRIAGKTKKPRDLYVPSVELAMTHGFPIYTADGKFVGITVTQTPGLDDSGGGFDPMATLGQMSNIQEMLAGMILPAASAAKATKRALASVKEEEE